MTSVVVFSTSAVVRAGLESIVNSGRTLSAVGSAGSTEELLEMVEGRQADVLLADLDSASDQSLTEILEAAEAVVTLTDEPDEGPVGVALRMGRRAVLPRDADAEEIQAAVEGAAAGLVVLHPRQAVVLTGARSPVRAQSECGEHLTPREIEVLSMLAEGIGNKTIARRLGISEHTVKFHVGSIMGKLSAGSRTEAVTTGVRQGLIMV
jgi:DNA-binding NarL/FixJ family response regulator